MFRRPPRSKRTNTLLPYPMLFRSLRAFLSDLLCNALDAQLEQPCGVTARGPLPLALRDDRIEPCQRGHRRLGETARPAQMAGRPLWTRLHQQRVAIAVGVDRYNRQAMPRRLAIGRTSRRESGWKDV